MQGTKEIQDIKDLVCSVVKIQNERYGSRGASARCQRSFARYKRDPTYVRDLVRTVVKIQNERYGSRVQTTKDPRCQRSLQKDTFTNKQYETKSRSKINVRKIQQHIDLPYCVTVKHLATIRSTVRTVVRLMIKLRTYA